VTVPPFVAATVAMAVPVAVPPSVPVAVPVAAVSSVPVAVPVAVASSVPVAVPVAARPRGHGLGRVQPLRLRSSLLSRPKQAGIW
jgi:hypothetical protein